MRNKLVVPSTRVSGFATTIRGIDTFDPTITSCRALVVVSVGLVLELEPFLRLRLCVGYIVGMLRSPQYYYYYLVPHVVGVEGFRPSQADPHTHAHRVHHRPQRTIRRTSTCTTPTEPKRKINSSS